MPRIKQYEEKYMKKDMANYIDMKMHEHRISQAEMGELLGISQPAFNNRLKKCLFTYTDLIRMFKRLESTDDEINKLMKMGAGGPIA